MKNMALNSIIVNPQNVLWAIFVCERWMSVIITNTIQGVKMIHNLMECMQHTDPNYPNTDSTKQFSLSYKVDGGFDGSSPLLCSLSLS